VRAPTLIICVLLWKGCMKKSANGRAQMCAFCQRRDKENGDCVMNVTSKCTRECVCVATQNREPRKSQSGVVCVSEVAATHAASAQTEVEAG
jgi:hypothetical protein